MKRVGLSAHTPAHDPPLTGKPVYAYDASDRIEVAGCSAAWLARLPWEQEVTSSNLVTPTEQHVLLLAT